jgi:hypothetical protein
MHEGNRRLCFMKHEIIQLGFLAFSHFSEFNKKSLFWSDCLVRRLFFWPEKEVSVIFNDQNQKRPQVDVVKIVQSLF